MKLKINIDFKIDREKLKDWPTDREIFKNYLSYAISSGFKNSLKSDERRIWVGIENKLENAINLEQDTIDINAVELVFLKKAIENTSCAPADAKFLSMIEQELSSSEQ